jgi:hypothetical protein
MNKGFLISLVFNGLLFGTIFYVKNHYKSSAEDYVKKTNKLKNEKIRRLMSEKSASNLLWQLATENGKKGTDKKALIKVFKNFVKKQKDTLQFSESRDPQNKNNWIVSWQGKDESYYLSYAFEKGKLTQIDFSGMLAQ